MISDEHEHVRKRDAAFKVNNKRVRRFIGDVGRSYLRGEQQLTAPFQGDDENPAKFRFDAQSALEPGIEFASFGELLMTLAGGVALYEHNKQRQHAPGLGTVPTVLSPDQDKAPSPVRIRPDHVRAALAHLESLMKLPPDIKPHCKVRKQAGRGTAEFLFESNRIKLAEILKTNLGQQGSNVQ